MIDRKEIMDTLHTSSGMVSKILATLTLEGKINCRHLAHGKKCWFAVKPVMTIPVDPPAKHPREIESIFDYA